MLAWKYISDGVMGGVSKGSVSFSEQDGKNIALLSGKVSTENNGGFIQIRKKVSGLDNSIEFINLKVKGNNQIYHVFLRTTGTILPWQYYKAEFKAVNTWKTVSIPISSFQRSSGFLSKKIKPANIKSIGLVAFGRDFKADLYVSEIGFR